MDQRAAVDVEHRRYERSEQPSEAGRLQEQGDPARACPPQASRPAAQNAQPAAISVRESRACPSG